jgi:hypothetical protein
MLWFPFDGYVLSAVVACVLFALFYSTQAEEARILLHKEQMKEPAVAVRVELALAR